MCFPPQQNPNAGYVPDTDWRTGRSAVRHFGPSSGPVLSLWAKARRPHPCHYGARHGIELPGAVRCGRGVRRHALPATLRRSPSVVSSEQSDQTLEATTVGLCLPRRPPSPALSTAEEAGVLSGAGEESRERQPALKELHIELWHGANVSTAARGVQTTMVLDRHCAGALRRAVARGPLDRAGIGRRRRRLPA